MRARGETTGRKPCEDCAAELGARHGLAWCELRADELRDPAVRGGAVRPSARRLRGTRIARPARSIDTATLSFGLVSIPVKIYSSGEPSHELHFNLVHEGCGERLHQQYVCPEHGKVERDEIIKGFQLTKGNFVELSKSELSALDAVASDEISIQEFVPARAGDP